MPYRGTTIRIRATLTDYDGSPLTPDSQEIKVYDPSGNQSGSTYEATWEASGKYYTDFIIPENGDIGTWTIVWKAVKLDKPNIDRKTFEVAKPV